MPLMPKPLPASRERKHRPDRPFAVMLPSLEEARFCCHVSEEEARWLASAESPIVLLRRRGQEPEVAGQLSVVSCQLVSGH